MAEECEIGPLSPTAARLQKPLGAKSEFSISLRVCFINASTN